jgi:hypothetical protein
LLTPYFENDVILRLRPYPDGFVGVWSHRAGLKIAREGNPHFALDRLEMICAEERFDVLGFNRWRGRVDVLDLDESTRAGFDGMFDYLMRKLGLPYSSSVRPRFPVLYNLFVARGAVMNDYTTLLERAIEIMESDARLRADLALHAPYRPEDGLRYTYHPFVCERLFSAYLHLHPELVCKTYAEYHSWNPFVAG